MDYQQQKLDRENCSKDNRVINSLEGGEIILLSTSLWKFSHINKQQERILLITNRNVYNITPQSTLANFFSKVVSSLRVKRKIAIQQISGLTLSRCGYEFVIHVPDEYDYRYSSLDFRDKIVQILAETYIKISKQKLPIYLTDDLNLIPYTTTKVDAKKGICKLLGVPVYLDPKDINQIETQQEHNNQKNDQQIKQITPFNYRKHFNLLKLLSQGILSQIFLIQQIQSQKYYVIKTLIKQEIITSDHLVHTQVERKLLEQLDNPFIIKLQWAFQTEDRIFFVLPFYQAGDLYTHLKQEIKFTEERTKFYIAQLVLALGYMHEKDYVHRDLKPENILLDSQGFIVLSDFGLSKWIPINQVSYSFAGTIEYMAPEIIIATGYGRMIDWWMLGIVLYELLIGITPFYSDNQSQTLESIQEREVKFPHQTNLSAECKDLIINLLRKDPKERLGSKKDYIEIQNHPWLKDINFSDLFEKKINPVWKPKFTDPTDLKFFESEEIDQDSLENTIQDKALIQKFDLEFGSLDFNV